MGPAAQAAVTRGATSAARPRLAGAVRGRCWQRLQRWWNPAFSRLQGGTCLLLPHLELRPERVALHREPPAACYQATRCICQR